MRMQFTGSTYIYLTQYKVLHQDLSLWICSCLKSLYPNFTSYRYTFQRTALYGIWHFGQYHLINPVLPPGHSAAAVCAVIERMLKLSCFHYSVPKPSELPMEVAF